MSDEEAILEVAMENLKEAGLRLWATQARGCYELAQERLTNAENWELPENRTNRGIRIPMRFFS